MPDDSDLRAWNTGSWEPEPAIGAVQCRTLSKVNGGGAPGTEDRLVVGTVWAAGETRYGEK